MSTLADLQRRNLAKMESSSLQETEQKTQQETETPRPADASSNELSIIPSFTQLIDDENDGSHDGAIVPSSAQSVKPSEASLNKAAKPKASKAGVENANVKKGASEGAGPRLKDALDAQLRAHLMEQLMPAAGKGPVTRLNVEMPEDLHQRLKQHCVRTRTPIKALINALIALYLEDEEEA